MPKIDGSQESRESGKDGACFSVDLGGSSVRVAFGSVEDGIVAQTSRKIDPGTSAEVVLDFIGGAVLELAATAPLGPLNNSAGTRNSGSMNIALAFPGLLGGCGEVRSAPNLSRTWDGLRPSLEIASRTRMSVAAANDARVATLGEWWFGASLSDDQRTAATMIYLGLGTGVGGGMVVAGSLFGGASGAAGEFGHVVIEANGARCACGSRGCVEAYAGGAALVAGARLALQEGQAPRLGELLAHDAERKPSINGELVARAARAGDKRLQELLDRAARALGVLAANLIHVISPDVIVVGGGLSYLGDQLFLPMWEEVRTRVRMTPLQRLRIEPSKLGDRAGLLGGLVLGAGTNTLNVAVHRSEPP